MAVDWNPLQGSAGIGVGGSGPVAAKKRKGDNREPSRTEGGYLIGDRTAGGTSNSGLWEQGARGVRPMSKNRFMYRDRIDSEYTYRGFEVPNYEGSGLVGMQETAATIIDGKVGAPYALGNTTDELNKWLGNRSSSQVRELQKRMYRYGWIGKNSITSSAETESFGATLAFLMYKGNLHGENWNSILEMGPVGLSKIDSNSPNGPAGGGAEYGVPSTRTTSSIDHLTKGQARAFLRDALASVLGRGPQPGEFNEFLDLLREKEENNPRLATYTSVTNSETNSSEDVESSGGMTEDDYTQAAELYARQTDPKQAKRYKRAGFEQTLDQLIESGI